MPIEVVGQQLRIRVKPTYIFEKFKTKEVGKKGRLQLIMGKYRNYDGWGVQSYRLNLKDYTQFEQVRKELAYLSMNTKDHNIAYDKAKYWWVRNKK